MLLSPDIPYILDNEGFATFQMFPRLHSIIKLIETQNIQAPAHLTRFNANLLHERSRRFWQREQWRLTSPVIYLSNIPYKNTLYVAPSFFVTDCSSVPFIPLVYTVLGKVGRRAATIHDLLYLWNIIPRITADRVFREALYASKTNFIKTELMFSAVFSAGYFSFKNKPGCLDYRACTLPRQKICPNCKNKYPTHYPIGKGEFSSLQLQMPAAGVYYL